MKKVQPGFIMKTIIHCFLLVWSSKGIAIERPLIFPIPQHVEISNELFILDDSVSIIIPTNASEKDIFEWVNKRFGKKIKEVNLHGTVNYQALKQDYAKPVSETAPSNAIMLIALSKVIKREASSPQ